MSNHTLTPWHISRDSRGIALVEGTVEANNGTALFISSDWGHRNKKGQSAFDEEKARANFDFMLLACNSHYELLEALKAVEARLTAVARAFYVDGKAKALKSAFEGWGDDIDLALAAIAKAEGQQ